jgi:hypothetical protein
LKKEIFKVYLAASNERNAEIHFPLHSSRQIGHNFFSKMGNINPLIFITNNRAYFVLRRFLWPWKKCRDMSSEGYPAHPVGCNRQLKIKMAVWRTFFLNFELAGWGVAACCKL